MVYWLSKLIPVPMHSTYWAEGRRESCRWWQWRGRVFRHRLVRAV